MDAMDVSTIAARAAKKLTGKRLRQITNERLSGYFGGAFAGLVMLFIIFHWSRYFASKYSSKNGAATKVPTSLTRLIRSVMIRKIPGFTSVGHFLVFVVYIAINLALTFYPVGLDWSALTNWAKRLGWMAVLNVALITFLALKNTPLAFLTAYSYERLNILHQVAGYCTVIFALVHGVVYIQAYHQTDKLDSLKETTNVVGIVAGFAMLIILITALLMRKLQYETFYITHVVMYMLILITVGMHRPEFTTKSVIIILFAAIIWALDRIVRCSKILFNFFGNKATVYPLPHGGTRIVLSHTPMHAVAGDHGFLWIPKIRCFETHPFTIVSTNPLEFVVSAYDGFTRDLHTYTEANPGAALSASIDGPYGTIPSFSSYDHVVLIAGGSGASFTAGVAVRIANQLTAKKSTSVVKFIWVVRDAAHLTWYAKELQVLAACPNVHLMLHVTRSAAVTTTSSSSSSTHGMPEKTEQPIPGILHSTTADPEKAVDSTAVETNFSTDLPAGLTLFTGRPDIPALIRSAVEVVPQNERIVISACGPDELMTVTRRVVASEVGSCGKSVELHCEQFGW